MAELAGELVEAGQAIGWQLLAGNGGADGAVVFVAMLAVAEPAGGGDALRCRRMWSRGRPRLPNLDFSHPGGVDDRAPPGSRNSSRWVVVWRPRRSAPRTGWVDWVSWPSNRLINVDFPTPEEPIAASVRPRAR